MNLLEVYDISKQVGGDFVLKKINFTQQPFQKIAICGETGSGKSTLLKIIAGLVQPDNGEVLLEGLRVKGPEEKLMPGYHQIAYLSQHFELRHHYQVGEILSYANQLEEKEVKTLYEVCRIDHLLHRRTDQLSGGEQQRIALARLLITAPKLLLLDEPFSNLDTVHKNALKGIIQDIGERLKITCMMVLHDPLDILSWADKILVMQSGEILQEGTPAQIYRQPRNEYAAALFGSYNLIPAAQAKIFAALPGINVNGKDMLVRPESFKIVTEESGAISGKVKKVLYFGSYYEVEVALPKTTITIKTVENSYAEGDTMHVTLSDADVWYI